MQEEMSEQQQQNPEPAGASARRKTILTTGLAGGSGTLLSLVTPLGPGWALGAALTTGALLFLENHGTPAEYAWVTSYLAPISRRLAARRAASRPEPKNVVALDQPRVQLVPDFQEDAMESLQPRVQSAGLPSRSPAFREMRHLMRSDVDILGFDGERFVSAASFKQAVNIAVIGVPGAGKTVCLSFHVAQSLSRRAIVRGWDIHGDVAADLGECCTILEDVDEIVADCDWIQLERESRLVARKIAKSQGKEALDRWYDNTREMVYIIDEFNALMLRLKIGRASCRVRV